MARSYNFIPWCELTDGWNNRVDSPKAPGLLTMQNAIITDRGGVAVRPGTELLGAEDNSGTACTSLFTAKRRDGTNILLRAAGTVLEYYNSLNKTWSTLKNGFTNGQTFGFANQNINTDAIDYLYFCNATEAYQRWTMAFDATTSTVTLGDTIIPVHSTLDPSVYYSGTASSVTSTKITMPANTWAANVWNSGFYVRITSGANAGDVSPISNTTDNQITFATITGLAGTPTFEIRRLKFPATGSIIDGNGTITAYTQIVSDSSLPVASAPAMVSGLSIAVIPQELWSNSCPRGNILKTMFEIMLVAGVREHPTTVYRSKLASAADFTYSSPRLAGEGDVIEFPDEGDKIYDLSVREDQVEVFKDSNIYDLTFTQDSNDLAQKKTRVNSPLIGTKGRTFRMGDDIVFVSPAKEVTSLSRVALRDQQPQRTNIAWPIKNAIRNYDFTSVRGWTFKNYTVIAAKETSNSNTNDKVLVYDNNLQKWIGEWNIPAADFAIYNNELYFASSASKEVYKMFTTSTTTKKGDSATGYDTYCETQWVNKTSDGLSTQNFNVLAVTGYVRLNTPITFGLCYDFNPVPKVTWTFDPALASVIDYNIIGSTPGNSLGVTALGVTPLGVEVAAVSGDHDEQRFIVYFLVPFVDHNWAKLSWSTSGSNKYLEITDIKSNFTEGNTQVQQKLQRSIEQTT